MNKLKLIPNYYFEQCRRRKYWTLEKASSILDLDTTYLNKIENGKIVIQDYVMHIFMNRYSIDPSVCYFCNFNSRTLEKMMDDIATGSFDESYLLELINSHEDSFYQSYLLIILFCFKAGKGEYDQAFENLFDSLKKVIHLYDKEYRYYFYLYAANYMVRKCRNDEYLKYKLLADANELPVYLPVRTFNHILYIVNIRRYDELFDLVHVCKMQLEKEPNDKIKNSLLLIQADYYASIGQNEYARKLYLKYSDTCKASGDLKNYAIANCNIAWLFCVKKDYTLAIQYYLLALDYLDDSDLYFDLAWCYYCNQDLDKSLSYISKGKKGNVPNSLSYIYLDWLERMIKTPYGKRCKQKLIKIYNNFYEEQSKEMKSFLLIALMNQCEVMKEYEEKNIYLKAYIELNDSCGIEIKVA